jgi:hypothetical protein
MEKASSKHGELDLAPDADDEIIVSTRQALSDLGCPDGGPYETTVCAERLDRGIWQFFLRSWLGADQGGRGGTGGEPVYKPNHDRVADSLDRTDLAANRLVNPPANFGAKSKQLAQQLADYLDGLPGSTFDPLAEVFQTLATNPTPEAMAQFDEGQLSMLILRLGLAVRQVVRQAIGRAIVNGGLSNAEDRWWSAIEGGILR